MWSVRSGELETQASMPISLSSWTPSTGPPAGCSRAARIGITAPYQRSTSAEEGRREIVDRPGGRRTPVPTGRQDLRMFDVEPVRQPLVLQLRHHERTGPGQEAQAARCAQVDEGGQVALRPGLAGEIDRAVRQLVEQPWDVARHGVAADLGQRVEPVGPLGPRGSEVVHLAGHDQHRVPVAQDPATSDLDHGLLESADLSKRLHPRGCGATDTSAGQGESGRAAERRVRADDHVHRSGSIRRRSSRSA